MLRLPLLPAGMARVLGSASSGLATANGSALTQFSVQTPRFSSSSQAQDDGPSWTTLATRNSEAWQQAVGPAFHSFLQVHKHLLIPVKFCVPDGDGAWPKAAWGYPLGKHAKWLRSQSRKGGFKIDPTLQKELDEMQFAWDRSQYKWGHFFLPALRRFYELNGHTDVHVHFVIPKGDSEWPELLWGQPLGRKVDRVRSRGDFAKQVEADLEELQQLNFCHDSTIPDRNWHQRVIPALRVFREEFGHCNVDSAFSVPSSSPWPKAAWGMDLGRTVSMIRCGSVGASRDKSELGKLGFVWNYYEYEWSERILPALETFYQRHGHCRIPKNFEVPSDENWPEKIHGLKLGCAVKNIRYYGTYFDEAARSIDALKAIEFELQIPVTKWKQRVEPCLATFDQLNGHRNVPLDFVVPPSAPWEEKDWGIPLGKLRPKSASLEADDVLEIEAQN